MAYRGEKKIIAELLIMYKDLPCLWDVTNGFYSNKVARHKGYEILLKKYKEIDSECTVQMIKKKIDNLRTTYRRERNKVVHSKYAGGEVYAPSLWYYDLLTFLEQLEPNSDECSPDNRPDTQNTTTETIILPNDEQESEDFEAEEYEPDPKPDPEDIIIPLKRNRIFIKTESAHDYEYEPPSSSKKSKKHKPKIHAIANNEEDDDDDDEPISSLHRNESEQPSGSETENDLFCRTISSQLKDLRPKQRFIAQKLISDVIFYGRLDKLRTVSKLELDGES